MVRRLLIVAALSVAALLCSAPLAQAQDPIVIPVVTTPEPTNPIGGCFQPMKPPELDEAAMCYPQVGDGLRFPKHYAAIKAGGYVSLLGNTNNWEVIWDDVGSGVPVQMGTYARYRFPLPGKYSYHCSCPLGVRGEGDIYVVGPRPRVNPILTSPDNKPPVSYTLDASASSVTDWEPWNIVKYEFDLNSTPDSSADGVYSTTAPDQSGTEMTAPINFDAPGVFTLGLRVTDDHKENGNPDPRKVEIPLDVIVPKRVQEVTVKPPPDELTNPTKDDAFKRTYSSAKIKIRTRSKISLSVLRKKGLSVRVTGLTVGDVLTTSLTKGKLVKGKKSRKIGSARAARASTTSMTVRVRLSRKAASILRAKPKAKTVRLAILVEGTDQFSRTYAKNIKLG